MHIVHLPPTKNNLNMKLYELRAYIGETRLYYTRLFTTMEAAVNEANRLIESGLFKDLRRGSAIYELEQVGDEFRFNCLKSTPVYLT